MPQEKIRLQKIIADRGLASRRKAEEWIAAGEVSVNGETAQLGDKADPDTDRIIVRGKPLAAAQGNVYLMLHKPRGYITTMSDERDRKCVAELIPDVEQRVYPVGRLDKDSEGLVLMTNQGDLVNKVMRSGNAHEKEYLVEIDRPVTKAFLKKMASGIWLKELNRKTLPCRIRQTGEKSFCIILVQGLNRQIRRMCAACGCQVLSLKRVRIMNLQLGSLKPGQWRKVEGREYREFLGLLRDSTSRPFAEANTKSREAEPWTRE